MPTVTSKSPKYLNLARILGEEIESGALKPGERLPTFDELRSRFGMAINTIDRALLELEQNGLVRREPGRGIFVNEQKVQKGFVGLVGNIFSPDDSADDQFYSPHLLAGVEAVARQHDLQMLLLNRDSNKSWDYVDGVLTYNLPLQNLQILRERVPKKLPIVSLLGAAEGITGVLADDYNGARMAVEHLVALGHRRIACLMQQNLHAFPLLQLRLAGYQYALQGAGIVPDPAWIIPSPVTDKFDVKYREWGRETVRNWLQDGWKQSGCTALLAQNDWTALGAIEALQEAGVSVPDEFSVVGFDSTEVCTFTRPEITAIEVPLVQVGHVGMESLVRKIGQANPTSEERITLPVRLQERGSTARIRS